MFFDLTKCVQVVTARELISGDVSASTLFTCPTPQVKIIAIVYMYMYIHCAIHIPYVVSQVSAHGHLHVNITRDFGPHGRLPGNKIPCVCIEAATMAP